MLRWRLLGAAGILIPLLTLIYLDAYFSFGIPGLWLIPLGGVAVVGATAETIVILKTGGYPLVQWPIHAGAILVYISACLPCMLVQAEGTAGLTCGAPWIWMIAAMGGSLVLCLLEEMRRFRESGRSIVHVALGWFVIGYIGLLFSFVACVRFVREGNWGIAALISMVLVVKMSDTGAYTFGRLWGKHRMSPLLSPKKTWEGAVGGLLFAITASILFFCVLIPQVSGSSATSWLGAVLYGLLVALAGVVGDLAESLLKRDMGCKDSSHWLPGLGGVLDVVDSVLVAAPVALVCWIFGLVG